MYFILNFVAVATGVGRGRICLTSFNSSTPKTSLLDANISVIFLIQTKLWPILSQISLPLQPGSVFVKFLCRHLIAWPRKPPVGQKDVRAISYTSRVIAILSQILLPWQQGLVVVEFVWRRSIAQPQKPPTRRKHLCDMSIQVKLWPILFQILLPWQPGSVFVQFLWRHSIAWLRKPPVRREDLGDISYTSRVIAVFVSNLVAMATGVGRGRICVTSTPKTPY